ncbi:MBL fold metallo-hydrolase [Sciscionella marina]|uniref:MBL fold metallo-hydrolase n=1 Tax=Sciscionella marina TaxID=508770 RepID=UPI00036D7B2F|nr:MBL fold metallo-hydrolase [Sciscionella marina]
MSREWNFAGVTVHRIDEVTFPASTGAWLLPDADPALVGAIPWLRPEFAEPDGALRLSSHSYGITVDGQRILVDTGIGNGKVRANPAWHDLHTDYPERLTEAGFAPESVDLVVLTHIHADHVGWNTAFDGDSWVPVFPNARYLVNRAEWDYWTGVELEPARQQMFDDSVYPVRAAGLLDPIEVPANGTPIAPGIRMLPTPGHTPGHSAVEIRDAGDAALLTGDAIHHPVQIARPELGSHVDVDPALTLRTRRELLARAARDSVLMLGAHFPDPSGGRVITEGAGYRLAK